MGSNLFTIMTIKIQRPSTFIRYTDNELTPEQRVSNAAFAEYCRENPEQVLRDADPEWGPAWERTAERLVRDEQEAGE